jgi:hypothetical protein
VLVGLHYTILTKMGYPEIMNAFTKKMATEILGKQNILYFIL